MTSKKKDTSNKKTVNKKKTVTKKKSAAKNNKALTELKKELEESKDKHLRLFAEFENYRRRTSKEKLALISSAGEDILTALLPILDDFERAEKNADKTDLDSLKEGTKLIAQKLHNILQQKELKEMGTKIGDEFDAEYQEAVTKIPAPSQELKGKIVDIIEKGYYAGEKIIRYAKVVIGE